VLLAAVARARNDCCEEGEQVSPSVAFGELYKASYPTLGAVRLTAKEAELNSEGSDMALNRRRATMRRRSKGRRDAELFGGKS